MTDTRIIQLKNRVIIRKKLIAERLEKIDEKLSENTKTPHVLSINVRRFFNLVK